MSGRPARPGPGTTFLWRTSLLLFASVVINYVDRSNLSVAAPLLQRELGLTPTKLGALLSAFFWSYAVCLLVSGWLVDRFNENWLMAAGFFLWSVTTAATGLAEGFAGLFGMRLLLGLAESVAFPTYSKILAVNFSENQRGLANSLIDIGTKCGPVLATLAGGLFLGRFGWRVCFVGLGVGALIWLPCWIKWMPRRPARSGTAARPAPAWREILARRSAWVTFGGMFCANYFYYFLLTWLPSYLVQERHFSMRLMGITGTLPFLAAAAGTLAAGTLSYRALSAGASPTRVRKTCVVAGLGGAAVIGAVPLISDARGALAVLSAAALCYGVYASSHWAITQTLAGAGAVGRWTGLQSFAGNLAGVGAPLLTGLVVARSGQYFFAFAVTTGVVLTGAGIYHFGLGKVEAIRWDIRHP